MKQLRPLTILAIGLPVSLLVNIFFSALIFSVFAPESVAWRNTMLAVAGSAWLLLSAPMFIGMALIRYRIGRFNQKQQKIRAAFNCCSWCFVVAGFGLGGAYLFREQLIFHLPIVGAVSFWIGVISVLLVVVTGVNIWVRSFAKKQGAETQTAFPPNAG